MSKRKIAALAMILAICMSTSALAESINVDDSSQGDSISVGAMYVENFQGVNIETVGSGEDLYLSDGTKIKVDCEYEEDEELRYVVTPVTEDEKEAYDYVKETAGLKDGGFCSWYIAFYKDMEKVDPEGDVKITIGCPSGFEKAKVVLITDDGEVLEPEYEAAEGDFIFTIDKSGFYNLVLGEIEEGKDVSDNDANYTGDEKALSVVFIIFAMGVISGLVTFATKKSKQKLI